MSRTTMFTTAILLASVLHGRAEAQPAQRSAEARRKIFAELAACRTDVRKKADEQYPELTLQTRGYSPKEDVKRFRERSRSENAGVAACERQIVEKYAIDRAELFAITTDGVCRQWPPFTGKPRC